MTTPALDGKTSFVVAQRRLSCRYRVTKSEDTLSVWLEDRTSKEQWQTEALALKDFVTDKNVLPAGNIESYARCFVTCLAEDEATEDKAIEDDSVEEVKDNKGKRKAKNQDPDGNRAKKQKPSQGRALSAPTKDGSRTLTLWLDFGFPAFQGKVEYFLKLLPVEREFVDVIAAKMLDVEDDIVDLKHDVKRLNTLTIPPPREELAVIALTENNRKSENQYIKRKKAFSGGEAFELADNGETIVFKLGGVFLISMNIFHQSSRSGYPLELRVNGVAVNHLTGCKTNEGIQSSLTTMKKLESGDTLKLFYRGNYQTGDGNSMSIVQLRREE
ncbi:hypothetical protein Poli38472_013653 [Pythium oligandrum]|uniref:Uncharacterized protein n=1 Tax=Pythium oligandrum TaxID=41045 RepID=A0A8K1CE92_PYTOL|nr:hypothetical protein Poli38472_013653 [Pythium oligandrum]|eukprot:TMW61190.1 hypothetical protein Poli38472_013653 [Pythium oligandrum]